MVPRTCYLDILQVGRIVVEDLQVERDFGFEGEVSTRRGVQREYKAAESPCRFVEQTKEPIRRGGPKSLSNNIVQSEKWDFVQDTSRLCVKGVERGTKAGC